MQRGVRAASAAAQSFVVKDDEPFDIGTENDTHIAMDPLHVAKVARIVDSHDCRTETDRGREPIELIDEALHG